MQSAFDAAAQSLETGQDVPMQPQAVAGSTTGASAWEEASQSLEPLGFMDSMSEWVGRPSMSVPFLGGATEAYEMGELLVSANAMADGESTPEQERMLYDFLENAQRDKSAGYYFGSILSRLPAFIGEIYATGGAYTAGRKAGSLAAKKAIGKALRGRLKYAVSRTAGTITGAAAQTAAIPTMVASQTIQEAIPHMTLTEDEKGQASIVFGATTDSFTDWLEATSKGYLRSWIELFSERTGGAIGKLAPYKAIRALQAKLIARFTNETGKKFGEGLSKLAGAAAWDGIAEEWTEERVASALGSILMGDDPSDIIPSLEQGLGELAAFTVPGVAGTAAASLAGRVGGLEGVPAAEDAPEGDRDPERLEEARQPVDVDADTVPGFIGLTSTKDGTRTPARIVEPTTRTEKMLSQWVTRSGSELVLAESEDGSPLPKPAAYAAGRVLLDANAGEGDMMQAAVAHELDHRLQKLDPEAAEQFDRFMQEFAPEAYAEARRIREEFGDTGERLQQELAPTAIQMLPRMLQIAKESPQEFEAMLDRVENRSMFRRILDVLESVASRLGIPITPRLQRDLEAIRNALGGRVGEGGLGVREGFNVAQKTLETLDKLTDMEAIPASFRDEFAQQYDEEVAAPEQVTQPEPVVELEQPAPPAAVETELAEVEGELRTGRLTSAQRRRMEKKANRLRRQATALRKAPAASSTEARQQLAEARELEAQAPKRGERPEDRARRQPVESRAERAARLYDEGEEDATQFASSVPMGALAPDLLKKSAIRYPKGLDLTVASGKANKDRNLERLELLAEKFPSVLKGKPHWSRFTRSVWGGGDYAIQAPEFLLRMSDPQEMLAYLRTIPADMRAATTHGMTVANRIGQRYDSGDATVEDTGLLLNWVFLSRMQSAAPQESGHLRSRSQGLHRFLSIAASGEWSDSDSADYAEWVSSWAPKKGAADIRGEFDNSVRQNHNAFGAFLKSMSEARIEGVPALQWIHEARSSGVPSSEIRRQFVANVYNSGMGNKVFSFFLLASGRTDVVVIDRWQARNFWSQFYDRADGSMPKGDPYDGLNKTMKPNGKMSGSGVAAIIDGPRGVAIYEALERSIDSVARGAYQELGLPFGGASRFHWESWIDINGQIVGHSSLEAFTGSEKEWIGVTEGRSQQKDAGVTVLFNQEGARLYVVPDASGVDHIVPPELYVKLDNPAGSKPARERFDRILQRSSLLRDAGPAVRDAVAAARSTAEPEVADTQYAVAPPTDSEAFRRWFRDSKVVDADGKPLVVYHGTGATFSAFLRDKLRRVGFGDGFHFAVGPRLASQYARQWDAELYPHLSHTEQSANPSVLPVYLSIQRPASERVYWDVRSSVSSAPEFRYKSRRAVEAETRVRLERAGFDGVAYTDPIGDALGSNLVYVAFSPSQIKSAIGNRGTFDPASDDIRYAAPLESFDANGLPEESRFDKVRRLVQSEFLRPRAAFRAAAGDDERGEDFAKASKLYPGRAESRLDALTRDYSEPLVALHKEYGISAEEGAEYIYALHAKERNYEGIERNERRWNTDENPFSGMSNMDADAIIKEAHAGERAEGFRKMAELVGKLNSETRQQMLDDGIIDQATFNKWENQYDYYVPLRDLTKDDTHQGAKGFQVSGQPTKKAKGRFSRADNPIAFSLSQAARMAIWGERTRVMRTVHDFIQDFPAPKRWAILPDQTEQEVVEGEQVPTVRAEPSEMQVKTKVDGKDVILEFTDPLMARALKRIGNVELTGLAKLSGAFNRKLSQLITSYSPEFVYSNAIRDTLTGLIHLGGEHPKLVKRASALHLKGKAIRAFWRVQKDYEAEGEVEDYAREFMRSGGMTGWAHAKSPEEYAEEIQRAFDTTTKDRLEAGLAALAAPIERLNKAVENSMRLSAYVAARENGWSKEDAAVLGKELTVNFNERGEMTAYLNSLYMFLNAGIQGNYRVVRALAKSPNVRNIAIGLAAFAALLDWYNRSMMGVGDDDEDNYDKIPDHVKDRTLLIAVPGTETAIGIPMPWGYNLFANAGRYAAAAVSGEADLGDAGVGVFSSVLDAFNPLGGSQLEDLEMVGQALTPSALKPAVQLMTNRNWNGAPIMREDSSFGVPIPDSERGFPSVSEPSRQVTEWLNRVTGGDEVIEGAISISPETIDHLSAFYTGGAGRFVGQMANLTAWPYGERPLPLKNVPILRRMVLEPDARHAEFTFWDNAETIETAVRRVEAAKARRDRDEVRALRKTLGPLLRLSERLKDTKRQLKALRTRRDSLEGEQKQAVVERMLRVQSAFNRRYTTATN